MPEQKLLTRHWDEADSHTLAAYQRHGGYQTASRVLAEWKPEAIVEEVVKSNLRGRGGAGFPTGLKWSFVRKEKATPKYLVINADEGEPGTFKDRAILERDPHRFIEGCIIGAFALDANQVYVYCRGEFIHGPIARLQAAIEEATREGFLGPRACGSDHPVQMIIHRGAGAYICGEETALLESLEGKKGWPRLKPPFPANAGLWGKPTAVNNVETLANLPDILSMGGEKFALLGCPKNGGTRLFAISGHVERPGVYEAPMGTTFRELLAISGGMWKGRQLKAIIPGGASAAILDASEVDYASDFDTLKAKKTMAGSGAVIFIDDQTCMVRALWNLERFFAHESCGQCLPCREGTGWGARVLEKLESGRGEKGDVELIHQIYAQMETRTICALADGAAMPGKSFIEKFRSEFDAHLDRESCPFPAQFW